MREVAWVVFDEIHYMRDKGNHDIFCFASLQFLWLFESNLLLTSIFCVLDFSFY